MMHRWKSFKTEGLAKEFAQKVNGKVMFRPLPDYMGMIENWVVEWD